MFLKVTKFAYRWILSLYNCEMFGQDSLRKVRMCMIVMLYCIVANTNMREVAFLVHYLLRRPAFWKTVYRRRTLL